MALRESAAGFGAPTLDFGVLEATDLAQQQQAAAPAAQLGPGKPPPPHLPEPPSSGLLTDYEREMFERQGAAAAADASGAPLPQAWGGMEQEQQPGSPLSPGGAAGEEAPGGASALACAAQMARHRSRHWLGRAVQWLQRRMRCACCGTGLCLWLPRCARGVPPGQLRRALVRYQSSHAPFFSCPWCCPQAH